VTLLASVIVSTRNRADSLDDALRSILADSSLAPRELIVVDNGSTDRTAEVVATLSDARSDLPVRYESEPRLGLSYARNRGIASARGEFLLFTDDDVIVQDKWADELLASFDDARVGAAGGRVVPDWASPPPAWLHGPHARRLALLDFGSELRRLEVPDLPVGANMAMRADLLRSMDPPFHTGLGSFGSLKIDGDEWNVLTRILRTHSIAYVPEAVVAHRIPAERLDWRWMRRALFQAGIGGARSDRANGAAPVALRYRIRGAMIAYAAALRAKRRNRALAAPGPDDAWQEFQAFGYAGRHLEELLPRCPRVVNWIAVHV
jgi:glycosyltransferase involved in cell wall biosynthesis